MKTDHQVHRNALKILAALAYKGLIPMRGTLTLGRVRGGFWCAYMEPKPLEGEEWKS